MAINVDGYGATAPATGPAQRLQTDARQTRWLYEVEHAMLLQAGKKPAGDGRGAAVDEGREPLRERAAGRERDAARADAAERGDAGAAVAQRVAALPPAEAPGGNGATAAAAHGSAPAAAAAGTGAAARTDSAASADGAGPAHGAAAALAQAGAAEAVVAASAAARDAGTPSPAAVQSLYGAAAAALQRGGSGSGGAALTVQKTAAAAPGWTLAGSAAADPAAPRPAGGRPEQAEHAEQAPPAGRRAQADGEQYASRLLHVYRDADGVHAWLRDAELGTAQARLVAQAMAAELGSAGAPLAALTVNGQRLPLAPGAGRPQRDDYAGDSAAPPPAEAPSPWTINANGAV